MPNGNPPNDTAAFCSWHKIFSLFNMEDKNEKTLQEQKAPLKNDDNAYVRVGQNGEPVFPDKMEENASDQSGEEEATQNKR